MRTPASWLVAFLVLAHLQQKVAQEGVQAVVPHVVEGPFALCSALVPC